MSNLHDVVIGMDAFPDPLDIVLNVPFDKVAVRPDNIGYSLYDEICHINFWLDHFLAILRGEDPRWPPLNDDDTSSINSEVREEDWVLEIKTLIDGLKELDYLTDFDYDNKDLVDWATTIIAHNAYHYGRMVSLRKQLGIWPSNLNSAW